MFTRSIRWQIQAWHGLLLAIITGTLLAAFYIYEKRVRLSRVDEALHETLIKSMPVLMPHGRGGPEGRGPDGKGPPDGRRPEERGPPRDDFESLFSPFGDLIVDDGPRGGPRGGGPPPPPPDGGPGGGPGREREERFVLDIQATPFYFLV